MEKLIITAALTGNITLPVQTPHLPLSPEQIIDDAIRAAEEGAASVHIHARDPVTAKPTTDPEVYRQIAAGINDPATKYDLTDENEALLVKAIEEFYLGWN